MVFTRLTPDQIHKATALGSAFAEKTADRDIKFYRNSRNATSAEEMQRLVFDDWGTFAEESTRELVMAGLLDGNCLSGKSNAHERSLSFRLFTEAYEKTMRNIISAKVSG